MPRANPCAFAAAVAAVASAAVASAAVASAAVASAAVASVALSAPSLAYLSHNLPASPSHCSNHLLGALLTRRPLLPLHQLNSDIRGATPAVRELNRTTNEYKVTNAQTLLWDRPGGVSMSNYSQNLTSLLYTASVHRDASYAWYVPAEPIAQLGVLLLGMVVATVLAWYCMQLRPNDACGVMCTTFALGSVGFAYFTWEMRWGQITLSPLTLAVFYGCFAFRAFRSRGAADPRSQPIWFPLLPHYWIPRLNASRALRAMRSPKYAAALQQVLSAAESRGDDIDSDVLEETRLVCTSAGTVDGIAAAASVARDAASVARDAASVARDAAEGCGAAAAEEEGGAGAGTAGRVQLVLVGLRKFFTKEGKGGGGVVRRWRRRLSRVCNPWFRRPRVAAVDGVSLTMRLGECFALLGHNGAGKTTTINMVTAQLQPDEGDALVCGASVRFDAGSARKHFGCCPQHDILFPELSAREHLELYGMLKGRRPAELRVLIPSMLSRLALSGVTDKPCAEYSGGMKRRLSFAIACIGDPRVLMLDEPTTGMDPMTRRFVWDYVHETKLRRVVLLTSHSMEEADILGDRIGIMSLGALVALGTSLHLRNKFGDGCK